MSEEVEPDKGPDLASEIAKLREDNKRLAKTIQTFQAKELEIDKIKTEYERSKLSEAEKQKAEQETVRRERDQFERQAKEAQERLLIQEKVNDLVAVHKLKNPEFGPILLKHLKEDEDLDAFAARMKTSPKYRDVFDGVGADDEPARDKKRAPPLQTVSTAPRGKGASELTDEDKAFAARRFPNEPDRQKKLLDRLLSERRGG